MNDVNEKKPEVNLTRNFIIRWVVILTLAILFAISITSFFHNARRPPNPPGHPWKMSLRSFGSTQLGYAANHNGMYSSFDALVDTGFIARSYTLDNLIGDYSITWDVQNISTVHPDIPYLENPNRFTLICRPIPPNKKKLPIGGITEDQVVRVFTPENGNNIEDVKSWDPVLHMGR